MSIEKLNGTMITGFSKNASYPFYIPDTEDGATGAGNRVYTGLTVAQIYSKYDDLVTAYPNYVTKTTSAYQDMSSTYDLVRYVFTPEYGYDKTMLITAGAHGTEKGGILSLIRIMQIICEEWKTNELLGYMRNNVRLVIIPLINPWGYANTTMVNYDTTGNTGNKGTNVNRNYDTSWLQVMSSGSDYSGSAPFSSTESQWVRDTALDFIGVDNLDYAIDMHDAGSASFGDYWINYNTHNDLQKRTIRKVVQYLIDKNISGREANIVHVADTSTFGVFASYFNKTLGIPASTVEACYAQGSTFDAAFMTTQIETRINAIIACAIANFRSPDFLSDKSWFRLGYWKSNVIKEFKYLSGLKSWASIIALWDGLVSAHPTYASKSATYVTTSEGYNAYTYILSPAKYKKTILIVGGCTQTGYEHERFAFAMYRTAELLCTHGNEDEHLAYIKNNVRLMFMPHIEYTTAQNGYINVSGNFNAAGVANLSNIVASNLNTIVTGITGLTGVIYHREPTSANAAGLNTDAVFTLASQDSADSLGVVDYVNWLNTEVGETTTVVANAASEFANYVYNNKSLACVRLDTGLDRANYNAHKSDYSGASEVETIAVATHLEYTHEVSRRITNIINTVKLMCR